MAVSEIRLKHNLKSKCKTNKTILSTKILTISMRHRVVLYVMAENKTKLIWGSNVSVSNSAAVL